MLPQIQVELLLIAEVVEQQRFADAGFGGNFADGALPVGVLGKDPVAPIENGLLLLLGQGKNFSFIDIPP